MVQEVQTWVTRPRETTLETIEAVGTSSVKIREWRQTTWHYVNGCLATWNVRWHYSKSEWVRDSGEIISTDTTITSNNWNQEFTIRDGWVRVPVAWTYQITLYWGSSGSTSDYTIIIKWWWKELYTNTFTSTNDETVTFTANLGKFDKIEIWWEFYYWWSSDGATLTFSKKPVLTIQQL